MSTKQPDVHEIGRKVSKHIHLLEELLDEPKRKAELADEFGIHKDTVYRRIDDLDGLDIVDRQGDGYFLTDVGYHIVNRYLVALEAMEEIYETRVLFREVPDEALPPGDALEKARTVLPDEHPEQLREEFNEWVLGAERVRGMFPQISYTFIERLSEELQSGSIEIDVAFAPETMTYLEECCPEVYNSVRESDSTSIMEASDLPPFGLVVVDEPLRESGLVAYTDDGYMTGFMRSATESGHEWAHDQFARHTDERQ